MSLFIEKAGILTTVQDLGRQGFRRFGINPNGVMDQTATRLINILLGNDEDEAVLEMHFPASHVVFDSNAAFAIGGGDFHPHLDGEPIENWRLYLAKKNSVLNFAERMTGSRAYLAVRGGFAVDEWLGSYSTNLAARIGGFDGRTLRTGDRIALNQPSKMSEGMKSRIVSPSLIPRYSRFPTVRITAGAEFETLTNQSRAQLLYQDFVISNNSDRMGFRLAGDSLALSKPHEMISSAVSFGTIQLLPDGQLIVLMADAQTAGGYPRIAHVITRDLSLIGQLGANDKVAFYLVDTQQAEDLAVDFERELSFFRVGCKFQANS